MGQTIRPDVQKHIASRATGGNDLPSLCFLKIVLYLRPELVDLSQAEPSPSTGPWAGISFMATGEVPRADVGEAIVASQISYLGRKAAQLVDAYAPAPHWSVPTQSEVEGVWRRFERSSRKYWVMSTTYPGEYADGPPDFPGWDALGE